MDTEHLKPIEHGLLSEVCDSLYSNFTAWFNKAFILMIGCVVTCRTFRMKFIIISLIIFWCDVAPSTIFFLSFYNRLHFFKKVLRVLC